MPKRYSLAGLALGIAIAVAATHLLIVLHRGRDPLLPLPASLSRPTAGLIALLALVLVVLLRRARAGGTRIDAGLVFAALMIVYLANGRTLWAGDTLPARFVPLSILREGNFDLDEFPFLYDPARFPERWFVRLVNGRHVSDYPVGAALLALPVYVPTALGRVPADSRLLEELEKIAAAAIVALSAAFVYLALRERTGRVAALAITAVYGLGTSALSASSQALWQHGAGQLGLAAALWCLVRGGRDPRWVALAGLPLAFAAISRPSNALVAAPLVAYVAIHHRRWIGAFVLAALPPVVFQIGYNLAYFGRLVRVQFFSSIGDVASPTRPEWATPLWDGVTGILLSPGRGLFVYSPVVIVSIVGLGLALRRGGDPLLRYAGAAVALTVLLYGKWWSWWGGASYGPRLLADIAPLLALMAYPVVPYVRGHRGRAVAVGALAAWSIMAHAIGAFVDDGSWNAEVAVDHAPAHLWSWTDNQLVLPLRSALTPIAVTALGLPTSATSPDLVSAAYRLEGAVPTVSADCAPIPVAVTAVNDGRAVWLARAARGRGAVRLAWRWRSDQATALPEGTVRLRHAVFPRESHEFRASITPPDRPGAYRLEIGLATDSATRLWNFDHPPIERPVVVRRAPALPRADKAFGEAVARLRLAADNAPAVALETDRPQYPAGGMGRLRYEMSERTGPVRVNTYLLLRGPGGSLWFYDGRELVADGCNWHALARGVEVSPSHHAVDLQIPLRVSTPGPYTWHLFVTEPDSFRILADASAAFELVRADAAGR